MQKDSDSPNLSTVEKASFLEGLQLRGGESLLILVLFMISTGIVGNRNKYSQTNSLFDWVKHFLALRDSGYYVCMILDKGRTTWHWVKGPRSFND